MKENNKKEINIVGIMLKKWIGYLYKEHGLGFDIVLDGITKFIIDYHNSIKEMEEYESSEILTKKDIKNVMDQYKKSDHPLKLKNKKKDINL